MVHLATKILLDDKTRFLTTVSGVAFAVMLVIVQVGIFLGMLESASITIERLDADLWVSAKNTRGSMAAAHCTRCARTRASHRAELRAGCWRAPTG